MWSSIFRFARHLRLLQWLFFASLIGADLTGFKNLSGLSDHVYLPAVTYARPEPPDTIQLVPFATDFNTDTVTDITHAGDGRLFVLEREGRIRIVEPDGSLLPTPFLDITHLNVSTFNWEQGLLGLAFHPDYATNGYFFLTYTANPDEDIRIMRFQVSTADPNAADPNSGVILMDIQKPPDVEGNPSEVHNGGDLNFGPDGYLYIGIGDGGPDPWLGNPEPGDPNNNGQRTITLLGKILRIDVDGNASLPPDCGGGAFYTIPADNPFADGFAGNCDEIWARGLRNPWRFSIDRHTGDMYIADVGEWEREEVNFRPAGAAGGANYGWHCYEGNFNYVGKWPAIAADCGPINNYVFPIFDYSHSGFCSSITGGFVYRGNKYPGLYGHYLFADLCSGRFWRAAHDNGGWQVVTLGEFNTIVAPAVIGEAANGELYVGSFQNDTIYHIVSP